MFQITKIYQHHPLYKQSEWKQNSMVISVENEKTWDKIQHIFMIRLLENSGKQSTCLNTIKPKYIKAIANIKVNGRNLEQFHWNQGHEKVLLPPYVFSIVLEDLAGTIRQRKEIKNTQFGKEENKASLCADDW